MEVPVSVLLQTVLYNESICIPHCEFAWCGAKESRCSSRERGFEGHCVEWAPKACFL